MLYSTYIIEYVIIFFREITGVKRDAEEMMSDGDGDMSSDDTDFNPDALEALSAKEEYDSEPSSTSDDTDGEEVGFEHSLSILMIRGVNFRFFYRNFEVLNIQAVLKGSFLSPKTLENFYVSKKIFQITILSRKFE